MNIEIDYYKERSEISVHQIRIVKILMDNKDQWIDNKSLANKSNVSVRTARYFTKYFMINGLIDMIETYPGHRYRWSDVAEKRNPALINRLQIAICALDMSIMEGI